MEQVKDRSLSDKAYDLFGELLLEQETSQMLEAIEKEKRNGATGEADASLSIQDQKSLKQIHSYFHRQYVKKMLTRTLPKVIQIAAMIIASISIAGGIALATNETVRVYAMKLITVMSDEYTSIKLVQDEEASFDVPADWQGDHYPSFIPSNLAVSSVYSYFGNNSVTYKDNQSNEWQVDFSELNANIETNLDTEDAAVHAIMIHDNPGFLAIKEGQISLYWSDGQNYFILLTQNIEETIAVEIAEGVKRIH